GGRIVRHQQHRIGVEALDQQSRALVERRVERTAHVRAAACARPRLDAFEQRPRGFAVLRFEKAEHRDVVAVRLVVQPIVNRRDAAHDLAAAPGEQQLDVRVREKRILLRREPLAFRHPQRRNPVRIACVDLVGVIDEPVKLRAAAYVLVGYYITGWLFVAPSPRLESWLVAWDRRVLGDPATRFARWPRAFVAYLEIVYMLCFLIVPAGFAALVLAGHSARADRYW